MAKGREKVLLEKDEGKMEGFIFVTVGSVRNFRDVSFSYQNGKEMKLKLSAFAVGEIERLTPMLFVPHSLSEEDLETIRKISRNQKATIVRSPSFGTYDYHYEIRFQSLVFFYLFHFISKYNFGEAKKFFADISVGLNQLTFAMLEAFRFFRVFSELSNLGETKKRKSKFYIVYSEPVIGRAANNKPIYRIYREDFKPKAFISMPVGWKDEKRIYGSINNLPISETVKRKLIYTVEKAFYIISSVLNNIPLAVYILGYDSSKDIEQFILTLLEEWKPIMGDADKPPSFEEESGKISYSFVRGGVEYRLICNVFLLLGFYLGISKILEKFNVPYWGGNGVEINELYEKFSKIYDVIFGKNNKNKTILKKDIERLHRILRKHFYSKNPSDKWYGGEEFDIENGHKPVNKRNFIAHSGLLTNLLEANLKFSEKRKIKIRYKKEVKEYVKKLIREI